MKRENVEEFSDIRENNQREGEQIEGQLQLLIHFIHLPSNL